MNSAIVESTGMSPAYVTFDQRLQMPFDCLNGMDPVQAVQD